MTLLTDEDNHEFEAYVNLVEDIGLNETLDEMEEVVRGENSFYALVVLCAEIHTPKEGCYRICHL